MTLDELERHWKTYRATAGEEMLSEAALSDLLPPEPAYRQTGPASPYRRILATTTRYAAVYGFLLICCQSC